MNNYRSGLLIGRFQPFHKGHLYLIKKSFEFVQDLTIGIGSSNVVNDKNPFSFEERRKMIEIMASKENIQNKIKKIIGIADDPSDDAWLEHALAMCGTFDVYIGNDEWTDGIFEKAGYKVLRIPYYKRDLYEGTLIRSLMRKKEDWKERVPGYIIPLVENKF